MEPERLPDLARRLQDICLARGLTVAAAESCTGGLVAGTITEIEGSSGYFLGGIVAYANSAKEALLGVPAGILESHGAVSAQVARAMAVEVAARTGATFGVGVTGVAGPGGGTRSKPVGLTYVAVAHPLGVDVRRFTWTGDRAANREATVRAALEMMIEQAETDAVAADGTADGVAADGGGGGEEAGSDRVDEVPQGNSA